jgi:GR25 family glycosyltransferase involved in LPS biosynthesis
MIDVIPIADCKVFPRCICLTIPEQRERQMLVVKEFEKVGIRNYEFFPGLLPDSIAVRNAYLQNCVKRYPDCFRCGKRDCGAPECNNVLLPVQVAVALSFQAILRMAEKSEQSYVAICEDDIVFAGYAKKIFTSDRFKQLINSSGLLSDEPTLVRLGRPKIDKEKFFSEHAPVDLFFTSDVEMSNYFFLVNRAFARLASERLNKIDHTADMIIHKAMLSKARCLTLNVQVVGDRSWSLGEIPSLIHPKQHHVDYLRKHCGVLAPQTLYESERLQKHIKKAVSRPLCFVGSPRCGSHFVSAFLQKNGIDVRHEALGKDGIASWQFSVLIGIPIF